MILFFFSLSILFTRFDIHVGTDETSTREFYRPTNVVLRKLLHLLPWHENLTSGSETSEASCLVNIQIGHKTDELVDQTRQLGLTQVIDGFASYVSTEK